MPYLQTYLLSIEQIIEGGELHVFISEIVFKLKAENSMCLSLKLCSNCEFSGLSAAYNMNSLESKYYFLRYKITCKQGVLRLQVISNVIDYSITRNYVQLREIIFMSCNFARLRVIGETSISRNYAVISCNFAKFYNNYA